MENSTSNPLRAQREAEEEVEKKKNKKVTVVEKLERLCS
jgi:hypothetical protein